MVWFSGFFLGEEKVPGKIGRGNKNQLRRHGICQLWVFCLEKYIWVISAFLLEGRILWGEPNVLCWYSVIHTPAGRTFRHIPSVGVLIFFKSTWRSVCQQTYHSVVFLRFGPKDISEMQSRISKPPLILFYTQFRKTYFTFVLKTPLSHKVQPTCLVRWKQACVYSLWYG